MQNDKFSIENDLLLNDNDNDNVNIPPLPSITGENVGQTEKITPSIKNPNPALEIVKNQIFKAYNIHNDENKK